MPDCSEVEEWRAVVGFEGQYEVSNFGNVRSLDRWVYTKPSKMAPNGYNSFRPGKNIIPGLSGNGYLTINIKGKSKCVQYLVAEAFIGPRPTGKYVLHGDGCRTNNNAKNLRYGTAKENSKDAENHGTKIQGSKYANAKLSEETAPVALAMKGVWPQSKLAKFFNVSPAAIQAIHDRRTWTHCTIISKHEALEMIKGKDRWI